MKIFLYNKYLSTSGGGEKHAGGIAEVLSKKHDVTILHTGAVDIDRISKKLNLDLSNVHFVSFGDKAEVDSDVLNYVNEHKPDIFINATYFSSLLANAPLNISLIFFPKYNVLKKPGLVENLKYKIAKTVFREYVETVRFHEGFGHEELINYSVGRWSYKSATLLITKPFKKVNVYYKNLSKTIIRDSVDSIRIHGHKLNFNILSDRLSFDNHSKQSCGIHLYFNTFKPSERSTHSNDTRDLGMFITLIEPDVLSIFSKILLKAWRSHFFKTYISRLYVKWTVLQEFHYYRTFLSKNLNLSNSAYTEEWIRKIYGKNGIDIEMLYPPVDVNKFFCSSRKENIILCVGRFFVGGHNKKQIEIIKAFKKSYNSYPELRDYKLYICGGTHPEKQHQDYLKMCKLSAQGYPIELHTDMPFQKLIAIYAKSKIFWHAAGMNEDENCHPDKFEHFGITTVEAMASGCVPVVIGVAGQKEIVKHMQNGMLWHSEKQLIDNTLRLVRDEVLCKKLSVAAKQSSETFNKEKFENRVNEIFDKLKINKPAYGF